MAITAVVSNGNLLIELDDGTVVNAGRVQGPAGQDGIRGVEGPRGADGANGRDGRDGSSIRTGLGTPQPEEYSDGDLYIDVQTIDLTLYQKIGGSWARLGSMKGQPGPPGLPGSQGGEGLDWGVIVKPDNPPTSDNSGESIENGDLWLDKTTGYLYVRTSDGWIPISDYPPVTVSADPPLFNPSSDPTNPNKRYPVQVGDLWFDSDQLALYTAVENVDGDLVWIIATPTDRTGVIDEVPSAFVVPAAADKDTAKNDATGIEYVYNAAKNQWIDFTTSVCIDYDETPPEPKCTGHLWFDNSDDQLTLYIYNGNFWIPAAPPVSLEGIKNTIDAALEVQNSILERLDSGEAAQATIQGTIDGALVTQGNLVEAVNTLENKVDALEGTVIDGQWTLDNRSIARVGHFIPFTGLTQSLTWDGTDGLQMHPEGNDGRTYTFQEVSIDDVIRIGASGSTAVFKVTSAPVQSGDVYNIGVTLLSSSGVPAEMLLFDFEFLPSFDPSSYVTKDYVDAQDDLSVKLAGENTITPSWRVKSQNKSFITINTNEMKLYNIADPTNHEDHWVANKGYVDKKADDKLPLAGGTLTGPVDVTGDARIKTKDADDNVTLTIYPSGLFDSKNEVRIDRSGSEQCFVVTKDGTPRFNIQADGYANFFDGGGVKWKVDGETLSTLYKATSSITQWTAYNGSTIRITAKDSSDSGRTFIDIKTENHGGDDGADDGYRMKLYHVADPVNAYDAANKQFVEKTAGVINPPPARFTWKFKGTLDTNDPVNLLPGEFIGPSLASWSYTELKWYFHKQPLNCTKPIWQDYQYENALAWQTPGPILSIWEDKDAHYLPKIFAKMKRWEIRHGPSSANNGGPHINCDCFTGTDNAQTMSGVSLERDKVYYINFGGIF